jgi:hypothetical protein
VATAYRKLVDAVEKRETDAAEQRLATGNRTLEMAERNHQLKIKADQDSLNASRKEREDSRKYYLELLKATNQTAKESEVEIRARLQDGRKPN